MKPAQGLGSLDFGRRSRPFFHLAQRVGYETISGMQGRFDSAVARLLLSTTGAERCRIGWLVTPR
jgi:hypothetical protein